MVALIAEIVSAVAGIGFLMAAIVMGNTLLAAIAIGIGLVGLILLTRDWLKERGESEIGAESDQRSDRRVAEGDAASPGKGLKPELFTPDVSYEEAVEGVDDDEDLDLEGKG